MVMYW
ncbi:hypothetical protein LINPERPRIM_LOCUS16761 [Linum perenne]